MSFFQFIRDKVMEVSQGVGQQQQMAVQQMELIQSFIPKVQAAWIGGDANEFAADVQRKVIPAIQEVIAAIAGINLNLSKATDVVDKADAKVRSMVDGLADEFDKI
jgi:uncharacterized protein YukE